MPHIRIINLAADSCLLWSSIRLPFACEQNPAYGGNVQAVIPRIQYHHAAPLRLVETGKRAVTRGASALPDDFRPPQIPRDCPTQSNVSIHPLVKASPVRSFHERCQAGRRQAEVGRHVFQQVIGRRAQRGTISQSLKITARYRVSKLIVPGGEAGLQFGRQRAPRTIHLQWPANPIHHQRFVIRPGFQGDDIIEQIHAQAGIFILRSRVTG